VEFSVFIQGYLPGPAAHDPQKEHEAFANEIELAKCADRNNWKFIWLSEHHALPEYSHLSANEAMAGYLAAVTERIHIGSGIFNLSPRVNHPVRTAEKVAMLDHLTNRRFEFGTGRGDEDRVGRGDRRSGPDVGTEGLHVPWQALRPGHAPQHFAQAVRAGAPADVGGVREPEHL